MGDKVAADFIYDPPAHNTRCMCPNLGPQPQSYAKGLKWPAPTSSALNRPTSTGHLARKAKGGGGRVSGQVNVDALPRNQIIKHNDRNII